MDVGLNQLSESSRRVEVASKEGSQQRVSRRIGSRDLEKKKQWQV